MFEENLIEAVQQHVCLFDKAAQVYRNKIAKEKAWLSVAVAAGATVEQCQSRWRSLRDRFVKEATMKPKSGSGLESQRSSWKFFEAMSFLQRHVAPRRTLSNLQWSEEESTEISFSIEEESASTSSPFVDGGNGGEVTPTSASSTHKGRKRQREKDDASEQFTLLCGAVSQHIEDRKQASTKSRNEEFLKVLDGYLHKHSEEEQDRLKIRILNMVCPE